MRAPSVDRSADRARMLATAGLIVKQNRPGRRCEPRHWPLIACPPDCYGIASVALEAVEAAGARAATGHGRPVVGPAGVGLVRGALCAAQGVVVHPVAAVFLVLAALIRAGPDRR